MHVRVLFFGMLKERWAGPRKMPSSPKAPTCARCSTPTPPAIPRFGAMARQHRNGAQPGICGTFGQLAEGDEIAFLPPVSGGSASAAPDRWKSREDGHYFALTRQRHRHARALTARLLTGAEGAVVTFEGTVRNHTKGRATRCLDYECYEPMALKTMARIGREIAAAHAIGRVAMVHRLGRMLIGETSVAVIVTAPHRGPAFEAALEGIDRLKKTGSDLEEGTFCRRRSLGGRRMGPRCSSGG